ncbi:MAG: RluA family pseudouridine synthase [Planctomycetes bacterium]|nr:RluA family pseudouridine synthase [Planctomycetota bacterium]
MREPIPILYEDDALLVALKPPGLLSVRGPAGSERALPDVLAEQGLRVIPVHRLDRDVSGAVLFARDDETRGLLEALFRERALKKTYWALAQGRVKPETGAWTFPILEEGSMARVSALGRRSSTRYRTLSSFPAATELEIDLVTGRYNQIRLHAAHAGFPLVGERKYARGKDAVVRFKSRRVALHAWRLAFEHPRTRRDLEIEAPLPRDLVELRGAVSSPPRR